MQSAQCLLPSEESITVVLRSLMESSIPFSFCVTWHRNKTYKTVVPCCSSIPLSLLGSIWSFMRNLVQHVKKSFGDQSQAKVPCPSNLRHMFKNNSLHFKWSSRSNFKFSRTPEKLFSFCSTSAQAKVCVSECVFHLLCSTAPYEFNPANSFAQHWTWLIRSENFMSFRCSPSIFAMETHAKHSDTLRLSLHLWGTAPWALFCRSPNVSWISATFPTKSRKAKHSSMVLSSCVVLYPPHVLASSVLFLQRLHLRLQTLWIYHHFKSGKYQEHL